MDSMAEEEKKKRRQAGQSEAATGCEPRHACPTELGLKPGGAVLTKLCKFLHLRRMQCTGGNACICMYCLSCHPQGLVVRILHHVLRALESTVYGVQTLHDNVRPWRQTIA